MKSPFKVLFSNDTVNTVNCTSYYHRKGDQFTQAMLEASIDETSDCGIDVHMIQPGLTMVPWWKSQQYPYSEHVRWYEETYQTTVKDNPYYDYMMGGGDMVEVFVRRCQQRKIVPFVSLRMNDSHGKEFVDTTGGGNIAEIPGYALHCVNRFYKDHPEYRIDPEFVDKAHWDTRVLNWANPEVVDWMFGFIREICENYDIGGLELDFMRHCNYFRQNESVYTVRSQIITNFIARVRRLLDRTTRSGGHRWLGARLPCYSDMFDQMGIDLGAMTEAGLEIINLSPNYHTLQQTDLGKIRTMAPNAAVHLELTHSTTNIGKVPGQYDSSIFLRPTDYQLQTAAHLAYARGASGVSAFNFAYFREFGAPGRGPFHEPPFDLFKRLRDPEWLALQPQNYFHAGTTGWAINRGYKPQLPLKLQPGERGVVELDLAPPKSGWKTLGRLRIRSRDDLGDTEFIARLNGVPLKATRDRSELYPSRYNAGIIPAEEKMRAWELEGTKPRDGINILEFVHFRGKQTGMLIYLDLSLS